MAPKVYQSESSGCINPVVLPSLTLDISQQATTTAADRAAAAKLSQTYVCSGWNM